MPLPDNERLEELHREVLEIAKRTLEPATVEDVRIGEEDDDLGDDVRLRITIVLSDASPPLDPSSVFCFWRKLDSCLEEVDESRAPHFSYVRHSELDGEAA